MFRIFCIIALIRLGIFPINTCFGQNIIGENIFFDVDPGVGQGNFVPFSPTQNLNSVFSVPLSSITTGPHLLGWRMKNSAGKWSHYEVRMFYVMPISVTANQNIVAGEWFLDSDPGVGNGQSISVSSSTVNLNQTLSIGLTNVADGPHILGVRFKNNAGKWSHYETRMFYVLSPTTNSGQNLISGEWFMDTDPGVGNGQVFSVMGASSVDQMVPIGLNNVSAGPHIIGVRMKNAAGKWSHYETRMFYVFPVANTTVQHLVAGEWFLDSDPGVGSGTTFSLNGGAMSVDQVIPISLNNVAEGPHKIGIRCKNDQGKWSHYEVRAFYVFSINNNAPEPSIIKGEWFVDNDPGIGNGHSFNVPAGTNIDVTMDLTLTALGIGEHKIYVRVQDEDGKWTHYEGRTFVLNTCLPGPELCNSLDDDCDGIIDNGLTFVNYYSDNDTDGFGAGSVISACSAPNNTVLNNTDCNDGNNAIYPNALEICNNADDDCDGSVDDGLTFVNYYNDQDGDGYGADAAINACAQPLGSVLNNSDCNDNNSAVKPGVTELCTNSTDDNCNGVINENCGEIIAANDPENAATAININQYGTGVQFSTTVNLLNASPSAASGTAGNDLWYQFVAQNNAVRISLKGSSAVLDDNDLALYNPPTSSGVQVPIDTEDDVHVNAMGIATDAGNEIMYYDQLVVGQTYYVCVRNNNATPGLCTLTISYLKGSQPDIGPYTGYTGVYANTCLNFKASYRPNALQYVVNRYSGNTINSGIAWTYTLPNTGTTTTTICQVGRILPANLSGVQQTHYVGVDVMYSMKDAYGNVESVYGRANLVLPVGLSSEPDLYLRITDQCPVNKSVTSALATNRSICGTNQYNWNFTMVYPQAGLPISLNGAIGGSRIIGMAAVTGMANGQRYDVKVRSKHFDGLSLSNYGSIKCVRTIGAAGMVMEEEHEVGISATQGLQLYPNPNSGTGVVIRVEGMEGTLKIEVMDAMGRLLQSTTGYSEGNLMKELEFAQPLSSGLYEVRVSNGKEQRAVRMVVGR